MADGGGRADDEYGVSLGGCVAGNSSEPMAQAYPDVHSEDDQEPQKAPNKANLESTQALSPQKVETGLTGPAGRKRSQSRGETEIQRREERPAAFRKQHEESLKIVSICNRKRNSPGVGRENNGRGDAGWPLRSRGDVRSTERRGWEILTERRRRGEKRAQSLLERNRFAVGKYQRLVQPRRTCFAPASRDRPLAQTAPLHCAINLRIKANRVPFPAASFKSLYPKGRNGLW